VKDLLNRPGVQVALARILVAYLKFALGTTRWTLIGLEHLALPDRRPSVLAFWHQRLALIPALKTLARRSGVDPVVTVLTSRHRDGMLVSSVMEGFSLHVVNGSTAKAGQEKGGSAALRRLLDCLREGQVVALTPDGPRGPAGVPAPGLAQLAALSGDPVVPCAAQVAWRISLPSWDRMVLPLPFGRGVMLCGAPIIVPRRDWLNSLPALKAAIDAITARADAMV
jgi:lysophospholipid acyltransferase (LPLAT)-like uncharacterized protein